MKLTKEKVMVACTNANGEADMFVCIVEVTKDQYLTGEHYDLAEELAKDNDYEGPFVCFDSHEQKNIARQVAELECPIRFELEDKAHDSENSDTVEGHLLFGWDGISVTLKGYSDCCTEDDKGVVAYLEYWDGSANLRAYADINSEEPTDSISLEGARNERRSEESDTLQAQYVSEWEEGDIRSSCEINVATMEILNTEIVDCNYQHLESEYVELVVGGKKIQLDADNGELTTSGKYDLKAALNA